MLIRLAEYDELKKLSQMMLEIFDLKMKATYTSEAEASFVNEIALNSLEKRYFQDSLFYISIEDEEIKGVLELERPCHIAFLFVKDEKRVSLKAYVLMFLASARKRCVQ